MLSNFSEDIIYTKGDLEQRTDVLDVSILLDVQKLFQTDWNNFLEGLSIQDEETIWSKTNIEEARVSIILNESMMILQMIC